MLKIQPQEGFQYDYLASSADIVIGGGAAGCGKTFALLLESIRNIEVQGFGAVIFRRTSPQIFNEGGLWDTSENIFTIVGGVPKISRSEWSFPRHTKIKFNHLEYETNIFDHQGAQYPFIGFDELTHFTKKMFFYMLSRNRSNSGVKPYIRATCNPDPDSWVAEFLEWWIDQDTGFPIPERAGKLRWFVRDGDVMVWGSSVDEVVEKCPHIFNNPDLKHLKREDLVKSVTFIPGSIYGNKELLKVNPQYLGNLLSLDEIDRRMLLDGNWKVRQDNSSLFNFVKIDDLFSNFAEESEKKYITVDVARFGRDLAVIKSWEGFSVKKIIIRTKSKTTDVTTDIEGERQRLHIPKSNVLVDQDGVGGGVVDEGGYQGFSGGTPAKENSKGIKENYKNLKTQCAYRMADRVNNAEASFKDVEIVVDGIVTDEVKVGKNLVSVISLIKADLRSYKRRHLDDEGKLQMNTKDEQKNILGGRSPDFGDSFIMREFFELGKKIIPGIF